MKKILFLLAFCGFLLNANATTTPSVLRDTTPVLGVNANTFSAAIYSDTLKMQVHNQRGTGANANKRVLKQLPVVEVVNRAVSLANYSASQTYKTIGSFNQDTALLATKAKLKADSTSLANNINYGQLRDSLRADSLANAMNGKTQPDWNATTGFSSIINKPNIPSAQWSFAGNMLADVQTGHIGVRSGVDILPWTSLNLTIGFNTENPYNYGNKNILHMNQNGLNHMSKSNFDNKVSHFFAGGGQIAIKGLKSEGAYDYETTFFAEPNNSANLGVAIVSKWSAINPLDRKSILSFAADSTKMSQNNPNGGFFAIGSDALWYKAYNKTPSKLVTRTNTPSSTSDTKGSPNDIAVDETYFYIKTEVGWKRVALSTF